MQQEFYAHGKLLISGEYLVLKGALALAVPTKQGQSLSANTDAATPGVINWKSMDHTGKVWMQADLDARTLQPKGTVNGNAEAVNTLARIIASIRKQRPQYLTAGGIHISTTLEFPLDWGLGSSSSLLSNLCRHAQADAFKVNSEVFSGSGYDIATATAHAPILFRIDDEGPIFDSVHFFPPEPQQFMFVHLGQKQNSRVAITQFLATVGDKKLFNETETISEISEALLFCDDLADFIVLLDEHEEMMQYVLQEEKIRTARFPDFPGVIKSLGAWGGDFVLAVADTDPADMVRYFHNKDLRTVIPYNDMVFNALEK